MIKLHPVPEASYRCVFDNAKLEAVGWHIPGMRNLADLRCSECAREFYGDLEAGQAFYTPLLLEKASGEVHDPFGVGWFADWLRSSYANRTSDPLGFTEEELRPARRPLLLNCLDTLYGHSLLKLLNAQYYLDHRPDLDLVILVPRFLRWLVPEGVAVIWTVDLPLRQGIQWNDWLGAELRRRVGHFGHCWLSVAYSHPHSRHCSIERFTRVKPFSLDKWYDSATPPTVTFACRHDRLWTPAELTKLSHLAQELKAKIGLRGDQSSAREQVEHIISLASQLQDTFTAIDFAVVGVGSPGGLPSWINDMRTVKVHADVETRWCERYARSQVVVGVHGSNMLLPSAHAGAVVDLMPSDRWGNLFQDLLPSEKDVRAAAVRYCCIPAETSVETVAKIIETLLWLAPKEIANFTRCWWQRESVRSWHEVSNLESQQAAKTSITQNLCAD